MDKSKIKTILPYPVAIILFLVIAFAYFPSVPEGKRLQQHDIKTWKGGANEMIEYEKENKEHAFWTNSMFGGMPTYLISNYSPSNIGKYLYLISDFGHKIRPVSLVFLLMFGFFIALLLFETDPWLSIAGALVYAFSTYFFIIIEAGHLTKVFALAFMPPIIAGIHYAYSKKALVGTLVMMIFLTLQFTVNHLQITYYTMLIIFMYVIFRFFDDLKQKELPKFAKTSGFLFAGALIALSTNFSQIITVYDYGKDSIRGKSELTSDKGNKTSGLDKDYATAWSYGKMETFNLLIPNLTGGASGGALSEDSEMYKKLKEYGVKNPKKIIKQMPTYWGSQPFTSGPVYIGALAIFLFILGLFLVKGSIKWWLLTATILSIMLSWGKNFMPLTDLFLDYFPMYNKFRSVSMTLIIAEFTIPLLGIIVLKNIIDKKYESKQIIKALAYSTGVLVGIILIFLINPGLLSFTSPTDANNGLPEDLLPALIKDRASIFRSDAVRSLVFILLGAGIIFFFIKEKIKFSYLIIGLAVLFLADLWTVNKRYLNADDFKKKSKIKTPFKPTNANNFILKDKDPDFRVLNLMVSTFNDASTSYFHKSIGGYHGAKMRRYQELIDHNISGEMSLLIGMLQSKEATQDDYKQVMKRLSVINMLNTKYFIVSPEMPLMNDNRLGNAWFVNEIKEVENADKEIEVMKNFDPEKTAVVDKRFKEQFFTFTKDPASVIKLEKYTPNYLKYSTKTGTPQLAVFSEIYYAKGWQAYIDGKAKKHFRANYILRAMKIPAGEHTVEFKFEPKIWKVGNIISLIGSIIFILAIFGGGYLIYKQRKTEEK